MTGELGNHRLRKTGDFQKILKKKQKIYNENFVIFYRKNHIEKSLCRFGISIPQRIVKKVVLRNKYKRQTKHALLEVQRKRTTQGRDFEGWDFIIIVRERFTTENFNVKRNSLEKLLNFFAWKINNKYSAANKTFSRG